MDPIKNGGITRAAEDQRQTKLIKTAWEESGEVYGYRKLDLSRNCAYLVKLIEDGLVHSEVIPDDDRRYVAGSFSLVSDEKAAEDAVEINLVSVEDTGLINLLRYTNE